MKTMFSILEDKFKIIKNNLHSKVNFINFQFEQDVKKINIQINFDFHNEYLNGIRQDLLNKLIEKRNERLNLFNDLFKKDHENCNKNAQNNVCLKNLIKIHKQFIMESNSIYFNKTIGVINFFRVFYKFYFTKPFDLNKIKKYKSLFLLSKTNFDFKLTDGYILTNMIHFKFFNGQNRHRFKDCKFIILPNKNLCVEAIRNVEINVFKKLFLISQNGSVLNSIHLPYNSFILDTSIYIIIIEKINNNKKFKLNFFDFELNLINSLSLSLNVSNLFSYMNELTFDTEEHIKAIDMHSFKINTISDSLTKYSKKTWIEDMELNSYEFIGISKKNLFYTHYKEKYETMYDLIMSADVLVYDRVTNTCLDKIALDEFTRIMVDSNESKIITYENYDFEDITLYEGFFFSKSNDKIIFNCEIITKNSQIHIEYDEY